jgi:NTP pyrophosphatase (non-canonical NTP hydrolase)
MNSSDWQHNLVAFHAAFSHPVAATPTFDVVRTTLRLKLMREELDETAEAMLRKDMKETADGLADLMYVVLGTAVELGINMAPVFAEVHRSNMAKLGADGKPITRDDGKTLKPDGWTPPDIEGVLLKLGWDGR